MRTGSSSEMNKHNMRYYRAHRRHYLRLIANIQLRGGSLHFSWMRNARAFLFDSVHCYHFVSSSSIHLAHPAQPRQRRLLSVAFHRHDFSIEFMRYRAKSRRRPIVDHSNYKEARDSRWQRFMNDADPIAHRNA